MKWLRLKQKCLFATKNDKLQINQITWCNLLPIFVIYAYGNKKRFSTITAISFGWLFWEIAICNLNTKKDLEL
jgi:hypothetical protein